MAQETEKLTQEIEKLTFPIVGAETCPHCGCSERIGQQIINQLKLEAKLQMNAYAKGLVIKIPLFQTLLGPLAITPNEVPVIEITFDVCKECKAIYGLKVDLTSQPVQVRQ